MQWLRAIVPKVRAAESILPPNEDHEWIAASAKPTWAPKGPAARILG